jgi:hypothetical protein
MSAHTPRPWEAEINATTDGGWSVYAPDRSEYAAEGDLVVLADYVTEADARLIAAAPDLLSLLREALARLNESRSTFGVQTVAVASLIERCEAAIAKAEKP